MLEYLGLNFKISPNSQTLIFIMNFQIRLSYDICPWFIDQNPMPWSEWLKGGGNNFHYAICSKLMVNRPKRIHESAKVGKREKERERERESNI